MALTPKQKRFADEYLIVLNATQAAIRAEYSEKTAYSQGQRLLNHVEVKAYLRKRRQELQEKTCVTQEMVLTELAKIGFSDIRKVVRWGETMVRMAGGEEGEDGGDELVPYHGLALIAADHIDDATAGAISEVSQGRDGLKVKMYDKRAALVDIGRHLGMFEPRGRVDVEAKIKEAELENKRLQNEKLRRELEDPDETIPDAKQVVIGVEDASDPDAK